MNRRLASGSCSDSLTIRPAKLKCCAGVPCLTVCLWRAGDTPFEDSPPQAKYGPVGSDFLYHIASSGIKIAIFRRAALTKHSPIEQSA